MVFEKYCTLTCAATVSDGTCHPCRRPPDQTQRRTSLTRAQYHPLTRYRHLISPPPPAHRRESCPVCIIVRRGVGKAHLHGEGLVMPRAGRSIAQRKRTAKVTLGPWERRGLLAIPARAALQRLFHPSRRPTSPAVSQKRRALAAGEVVFRGVGGTSSARTTTLVEIGWQTPSRAARDPNVTWLLEDAIDLGMQAPF